MPTKQISTRQISTRQRFDAVFGGLAAAGVAYCFNLNGDSGVRDWNLKDYKQAARTAGTDRWVGTHVGTDEITRGGHWGDDGVLYVSHGRRALPCAVLLFSFNHDRPEIAKYLVRLFREQGIDASWSGEARDCVVVNLGQR